MVSKRDAEAEDYRALGGRVANALKQENGKGDKAIRVKSLARAAQNIARNNRKK